MNYPDDFNDILDGNLELDEVLKSLLASIAYEQKALGKLILAESEKIKYAVELGKKGHATPEEVKSINDSVNRLLRTIAKKEMLIEFQLEDIMDYIPKPCPRPCPPKPCPPKPCPPRPCSPRRHKHCKRDKEYDRCDSYEHEEYDEYEKCDSHEHEEYDEYQKCDSYEHEEYDEYQKCDSYEHEEYDKYQKCDSYEHEEYDKYQKCDSYEHEEYDKYQKCNSFKGIKKNCNNGYSSIEAIIILLLLFYGFNNRWY
ncbi:hypothetical protein [Clostridium cylindrosporum]|uniref:Uncharacterized protein n=1 Tax=Clostridium cylindrosporum DSM 605 TaxID=1121307 RepID=A0A0J8D8Q5_CLOCY|nr:hypothetical protein [Clostridium cylindrosporum]KMT22262.1 hypothetical protein CLCY_4c02350 [Clostridium cylindrosporum DSM 605]